jgi:hypothetical protein
MRGMGHGAATTTAIFQGGIPSRRPINLQYSTKCLTIRLVAYDYLNLNPLSSRTFVLERSMSMTAWMAPASEREQSNHTWLAEPATCRSRLVRRRART